MKKLMMLAAAGLMMFAACAETEVVDGIEWTYAINDGKAQVGGGGGSPAVPTSTTGAITIPSTLGGCPVTRIGNWAFFGCSGLTSVTIPLSVTSIGTQAFLDCSGLTSMTIPLSVTSIGDRVFDSCSGLTAIDVAEGNVAYSSLNGFLCNKEGTVLIQCPAGKRGSVTIPSGVTTIGSEAFFNCGGLTSVTIPSGVKSIEGFAFSCCGGLTVMTIPPSVKNIGHAPFFRCEGLKTIVVESGNTSYCSIDGAIYDKDGLTLIQWPAGRKGDAVIPSGVKIIGVEAFGGCCGLTSVVIPLGVTRIERFAFEKCFSLTSVTIPPSVTSIEDATIWGESLGGTFIDCDKLKTIYVAEGDGERVKGLLAASGSDTAGISFVEKDIEDSSAGDWSVAHNFSGVVLDVAGNSVGMIQIATKKATKKGVGVSGTMMLQDGKKITLKSMTVAPEGGVLNVAWTVKGYGKLNVTIGAEGFSGQFEDGGSVESQELDEDTGVLKASITMTYIDKKTGKMKTKKITFGGFVSGGEGVGTAQAGKKNPVKDVEFVVR